MRILANVFHPAYERSRVIRLWGQALEESGCQVRVHQGRGLDPEAEQRACEEAEALLFVHPFHWYGPPWPMKEWIDQVLAHGWAFGGERRLAGRSWVEAVAVGAPEHEYGCGGSRRHSVEELLRPLELTASYCGMDYRRPFLAYGAGALSEAEAEASAQRLVEFAKGL